MTEDTNVNNQSDCNNLWKTCGVLRFSKKLLQIWSAPWGQQLVGVWKKIYVCTLYQVEWAILIQKYFARAVWVGWCLGVLLCSEPNGPLKGFLSNKNYLDLIVWIPDEVDQCASAQRILFFMDQYDPILLPSVSNQYFLWVSTAVAIVENSLQWLYNYLRWKEVNYGLVRVWRYLLFCTRLEDSTICDSVK